MMMVLLGVSLYFVYTGGQIAVIIADFFQGVFATVVLVIVALYLFFNISWDQVSDSLEQTPIKLANEEIEALNYEESFSDLSKVQKQEKKKLVHIKDCLSELKIQALITQHKPLKTNNLK